MAFQDAMKFCCLDAGMDALAASSRLSKEKVEEFSHLKEYKNFLQLSRQYLTAFWICMLDVVSEEGLLLCSDPVLQSLISHRAQVVKHKRRLRSPCDV